MTIVYTPPSYVPHSNPKITNLNEKYTSKTRSISASIIKPLVREDGVRFCAWCNKNEITKNRKYCSEACTISMYLFVYPTGANGFDYLYFRQNGKCNLCNLFWDQYYQRAKYRLGNVGPHRMKDFILDPEHKPEIDHIKPVAMGGVVVGHDNLQLICSSCHKKKTKNDVGTIAKAKRMGEIKRTRKPSNRKRKFKKLMS